MNAAGMIAFAGLSISMAYTLFAILRVATFKKRRREAPLTLHPLPAARGEGRGEGRPVTIGKPVFGMEPELAENLRSFCDQDYPQYEVLFAVRDPNDPAIPVIQQLGGSPIIEPRAFGANPKIGNLMAIAQHAKHDTLVISDSDMRVGRDYLRAVMAAFEDESVGAVTCLYIGRAAAGNFSRLHAMFINEAFLPSVLVATAIQPLDFCFGATMAVRRKALEDIGGFQALAGYLADDYMLGHLIRRRGWKIELAPYVVENVVSEPTMRDLFLHELRWARTIRTVRPAGYAGSVLTMVLPWAIAFLLLSPLSPLGWSMFAAALLLRVGLHVAVRLRFHPAGAAAVWWIPLRDGLSFLVYCASHLGRSVTWKQTRFNVSTDGQMHHEEART